MGPAKKASSKPPVRQNVGDPPTDCRVGPLSGIGKNCTTPDGSLQGHKRIVQMADSLAPLNAGVDTTTEKKHPESEHVKPYLVMGFKCTLGKAYI